MRWSGFALSTPAPRPRCTRFAWRRGYTKRGKIAKFEGGYHGSHDAVEVSVAPPLDQAGPADAPIAVPTAGGMSPSAASEAVILPYSDPEAVERLVAEHASELACVLFDPKAGVLDIQPDFARAVRDITRRHGVLLILDEIVGFRTDTGGLQGLYGIDPDLELLWQDRRRRLSGRGLWWPGRPDGPVRQLAAIHRPFSERHL